ncbi:MAG TPA: NADH:ubiquinone reductase (Na(+)-transporting) subunit F [Bacteroidales bacterium]|nr:NADH:ubiquinone reductase (Na(+)-transporting) subunit F [Bacteroidales bacterium]
MTILAIGTTATILISVAIFLGIILFLVAILLYARNKLTPQGNVNITINNEKVLDVMPGSTLLSTLSSEGIFLPSACGGGGTCAMCRCQVFEGAGEILPTEKGYFTRKEQQNYWRLGCQVKVRDNLRIGIPKEIFGIKKFECEVVSNRNVATFIKEFKVRLPEGAVLDFQPGGYIQIDVPKCVVNYKDIAVEEEFLNDWEQMGMFELTMKNPEPVFRAYSMANYPAEGNVVMLNIRIATPPLDRGKNRYMNVNPGICSSYLFSRKPGDMVTVSGPYGEFHIKPTQKEMVYIGGGAGMAPLRSQIFHLFHTEKTNRKVSYWYGARSLREVFYADDFHAIEKQFENFSFNLALSEPTPAENWKGLTGYIHQVVLDKYLCKHPEPEEIEYYLCGPPVMNDAVLKMLDNFGIPKDNIAFDDFGI